MDRTYIPLGTTHVFINTKNKKSFYFNNDGQWFIYNKGLETWEKVPNLELTLIPIESYLNSIQSDTLNTFKEIVDTEVSVTNVTVKSKSTLKNDFINPPITIDDYIAIYDLFEKYSDGQPLGFIPAEPNYTVSYNHTNSRWQILMAEHEEGLTIYTSSIRTASKVVEDLNSNI